MNVLGDDMVDDFVLIGASNIGSRLSTRMVNRLLTCCWLTATPYIEQIQTFFFEGLYIKYLMLIVFLVSSQDKKAR